MKVANNTEIRLALEKLKYFKNDQRVVTNDSQKKRKRKRKKNNQKIVKPKKHIKGSFLLSLKSERHKDSLRASYCDVTAIVINRIPLLPNTSHVSTCRS